MEKSKYYIVIGEIGLSIDRMERADNTIWLYSDKKVITFINLLQYKILFNFKSDDDTLHFKVKKVRQ